MSTPDSGSPFSVADALVGPAGERAADVLDAFVEVALDGAWDLFAVLDADGRVRYASPSNYALLGYTQDDLTGRDGFALVHPDDRPRLTRVRRRLHQRPETPITFAHQFRVADGTWRTLETTLQNRLGHPVIRGLVVHSRDVTDRDKLHAELGRAQQQLRRLQIHPHFVLNVLQAIQEQVRSDPDAATETIVQFGDLLRLSYAHVDAALVPLGDEVEFVERYVALYRHRFPESVQATIDVPGALRPILVPTLLLQPLVENALTHGLRPARGGGLAVRARRRGNTLRITVRDDGVGGAEDAGEADGIGLSVTRTRLRQHYGAAASLRIEAAPEGGTVATVVLPLTPPSPEGTPA
jgi:PAS domain S-box-containing protein